MAVGRLGKMLLGLAAAYLAAIAASLLCAPVLGLLLPDRAEVPLLLAPSVGFHAALPAVVVIIIGELTSIRSPLLYGGAGVLLSGGVFVVLALLQRDPAQFLTGRLGAVAIGFFVVCGLAAGLGYWLVAGRNAGNATGRAAPRQS